MSRSTTILLAVSLGSIATLGACVGSEETRPLRLQHNPHYGANWVQLADTYSAQTDQRAIDLNGRGGEFRRLRVESVRGAPVINQIAIEFANGEAQQVSIHTRLPSGEAQVIDLDRDAPIRRIVVYADPRFGGAYSVFGT